MIIKVIQARGLSAFAAAAAIILSAAPPCRAIDTRAGAAEASSAAASFAPKNAPYGFFGGRGACARSSGKTPVVFIHGNANSASDWNALLKEYRAAGYDDCNLFGVTWLSPERQKDPFNVKHGPVGAGIIADFIEDVKRYTGSAQVDIVAHSMGVTQALAAIDSCGLWSSVRKFVAIAGAMRGLESCRLSRLAVCSGQFKADPQQFGFLPPDVEPSDAHQDVNQRMGRGGFPDAPRRAAATRFYSIFDGRDDEVLCMAPSTHECVKTALFTTSSNVFSQLTVETPGGKSFHHFQIRDMTGSIQREMLDTDCKGFECAGGSTAAYAP